ncbi:MAG: hypothetical protein ACRKGH_04245 [Dehalogenimonas sp.]
MADHIVYVDQRSRELETILSGSKTLIIRGAAGRKLPYGRVFSGDTLFFVQNNGEGRIRATAKVRSVFNSNKLSLEESTALIQQRQPQLQLSESQKNKYRTKRFLVLIEIGASCEVEPFCFDRSGFGNMDDWLPVEDINRVKLSHA